MKNSITSLHNIHHHVFTMNYDERKVYLNNLRNYIKDIKKTEDINTDFLNFGIPVFMLAYFGLSIRDIMFEVVDIYKNLFANYINEINNKYSCKNSYNKNYKKILFCSSRLSSISSVYRSTYEIINHLSKNPYFHVDLMTTGMCDDIRKTYSNCKNIYYLDNIYKNIEIIGGGRYDAIIYPDMNMDPSTSCIGLFRLAPTQITTFGHSETSGLADYFVTSKFYEIEPQNNYTEKTVCFDSLALKYQRINLNDAHPQFKGRDYYQIPEGCNIYYCNSSFFKMGKEMFSIFKQILEKDKDALIILTKLGIWDWDSLFFKELDKQLSIEYKNRIRFIARLNHLENLNLLYLSNVFLESYPFGNMNSTLESFSMGLPVVSIPTTKINGRFTYGFYKKMNLENEYCFDNEKDYVNKAVEIATSRNNKKRDEIYEKSKVLFEDQESVEEWESFLRKL